MSDEWPPVAIDTFQQVQPALAHIRVMQRFLHEVVEPDPELRPLYDRLLAGYVDLLQKVLEPYALDMATVLTALEDEYAPKDDGPSAA